MSPLDFSRCVEYIRKNCSSYNILDVSFKQLLVISAQHLRIEAELEKIEERIVHLRKQKKMWREKLTYTISRDIFDIEELEKMEAEEAVRSSGVEEQAVHAVKQESAGPEGPLDSNDWLFPSDFVLSSSLLVDLGILGNVETFSDIRSGF